jgi:hypothetical protein
MDRPDGRPPHRPTGASLVALIAVVVTAVGIAVLHVVRSDLDWRETVMSHYANGDAGPVMTIVFYAFGAISLALAFRLRTAIDRHGVTGLFPYTMAAAGVASIVAGIFEVDRPEAPRTTAKVVHSDSAIAAFVLLVASMALFTLACRHDERWSRFRLPSAVLTSIAIAAAVGTRLADGTDWSGAVQRVLAGAVLAWLLLVIIHVRSKRYATSSQGGT